MRLHATSPLHLLLQSAPDGSLINGQQLTMLFAGGPGGKDIAEKVGVSPKTLLC
jgi:hypothetical protein